MRIKFIADTTIDRLGDKYTKFYKDEVVDLPEALANDMLIIGVVERYYQESAVKIRGKHLHKASMK